ncbi:MAG: hypothetical protein ACK5Q5_18550 [Planctomycetaceae bacterium]
MLQSMSAAGNCYDNAFMASCFGTVMSSVNNVLHLKKTELTMTEYASGPEALRELTAYLHYDNGDCRHSSLGYVSPAEFERNLSSN